MAAGWREIVADQIAVKANEAKATQKRDHGQRPAISRVGFAPAVMPMLIRAARERGISIAGYIRRATMAFVAKDLGIDPVELFAADMAPSPYGQGGMQSDRDLDGSRYGTWKACPDESRRSQ